MVGYYISEQGANLHGTKIYTDKAKAKAACADMNAVLEFASRGELSGYYQVMECEIED